MRILEGRCASVPFMIFIVWSWRSWLLMILAAVAVAGYFGVFPTGGRALGLPTAPAGVARLADQPTGAGSFSGPIYGRMDAGVGIFIFIFLSPPPLLLVVTMGILILCLA